MEREKEPVRPSRGGRDCPGGVSGEDCRCDECDYLLCCLESSRDCRCCGDPDCPWSALFITAPSDT